MGGGEDLLMRCNEKVMNFCGSNRICRRVTYVLFNIVKCEDT